MIIRLLIFMCLLGMQTTAQTKSFLLTDNGDTLNKIDNNNQKQGRWKIRVNALRGEPAYDEEGIFKNNLKEGVWRKYDAYGLLTAKEDYKWNNKNGLQVYLSQGQLEHEENWRAIDPEKKFDTIDVPDVYDILKTEKKIIKLESYAVPYGTWRYYDSETGRQTRTENYDAFGKLFVPKPVLNNVVTDTIPKKIIKPKEILDFEKSRKGKKSTKMRDGMTG